MEFALPPYDIDVLSYTDASWVSTGTDMHGSPTALVRLLSNAQPFDTVQVAILDPHTLVPREHVLLPFAGTTFTLVRRSKREADVEIREIVAID